GVGGGAGEAGLEGVGGGQGRKAKTEARRGATGRPNRRAASLGRHRDCTGGGRLDHAPMPDDLSTVRRAEHAGARWTTYLLFACLALDAVAIVSGFSQRSLLARAMAGAQLLPGEAAASPPRHGP